MADTNNEIPKVLGLTDGIEGYQSVGDGYSALDADTLVDTQDPSKSYRQPNIDAPEVDKVIFNKDTGNYEVKEGALGGQETTDALVSLGTDLGFNNVVVKNQDEEAYGRGSAVRTNKYGQSYNNFLLSNGMMSPSKGADDDAVLTYEFGKMLKPQREAEGGERYKTAVKLVKDIVDTQYGDEPRAKRIAYNELEYATSGGSEFFQPFVASQSYDKNLDNTAVNPLLTSADVGIESMVGSLYGAAFMLGDVTGLDGLRDFGGEGAYQSAQNMQNYGKFKSDFEEIEDFGDTLEFLGTNIAMSVPYMATTAAALALAPVTGGASLAIPVSIYTGQVWNEQPVDKKNAISAITAGSLMAALDAVGVKGIGKVATKGTPKEVFNSAVETLQKARPDFTAAQAKSILLKESKLSIAKLAGNAGDIAKEQLKKRNIFKDSVSRVMQSGAIEGSTEAMQEMLGYIGANYDNPAFDFEEMQERMFKAAVTGGALGSTFGVVGSAANVGGWVDASWRSENASAKNLSDAGKRAVELESEGVSLDLENQTAEVKAEADDFNIIFARELTGRNQEPTDGAVDVEAKDESLGFVLGTVDAINKGIEQFKVPGNSYEYDVDGVPEEGITIEVATDPDAYRNTFNRVFAINQDKFKSYPELKDVETVDELLSLESDTPAVRSVQQQAKTMLDGFNYETIEIPQAKVIDYINKNDIDPMATEHKKVLKETSRGKQVLMGLKAFPAYFFKGAVAFAIPPNLRERSRSAQLLFDMFGGGNQTTYSGFNFEEFKSNLVAMFRNQITDADSFYENITGRRLVSPKLKSELGKQIHKILNTATVDNVYKDDGTVVKGKFDPSLLTESQYILTLDGGTIAVPKSTLVKLGYELEALSNDMYDMQTKYNADIGYLPNYLARFKTLNKNAIENNRQGFIKALMEHTGVDIDVANKITDDILNNTQSSTLDGMFPEDTNEFSVTKGGVVPGSHKKRSINMAESDLFEEFMEQDIFRNVAESAKQTARYLAYQKFVGKNGKNMGVLLKRMRAEGVSEEEVNRSAKYLKDYLDAESGNYNRPEDSFGKTIANAQKSMILISTLVYLPLATVSSIVELAIVFKGLNKKQIFDEKSGIKGVAKEIVNALYQGIEEVGSMATRKPTKSNGTIQQRRMKELGYYSWDVGAATTTGVTEVSATRQRVLETFFKVNLLQGFTQMTRAIRLSYAYDYLADHIGTVVEYRPDDVKTNDVQQSEETLRNLGINIQELRDIFTGMDTDSVRGVIDPEQSQRRSARLEEILRLAETRFVNEASMLPTGNKVPLFYQDPRFALFNQFQGFIAMFTSTFIPKLWGEYIKRGSPSLKYNAFATMAGMILLGFISQDLKDRLKYGETSPYLDDLEYVRRGLSSSGLLGTSERFADTLFPIYEDRSDNSVEWMYNQIIGQSPSLGFVDTGRDAILSGVKGEGEKAIDKALKLTPVGLFTNFRKTLADKASNDWNPFGD